jgi:quinolinate synthase
MSRNNIVTKIDGLKRERDAVILGHNYQPPEIQDIADVLGDSLDLSRTAQSLSNRVIIFCGVHFMAETAAILSPEKKVILPEPTAGCPMADMITAKDLSAWKSEHPDAAVVMYVNSTAEVKALTDICCTSANAVKVIESIPAEREIIFGPDRFLGGWVSQQTGRKMILWKGYCPSHQRIFVEQIRELKKKHPGAAIMVHPEVNPAIAAEADAILGTGGMIRYAGESRATTFIVGTEVGMLCRNMKKITLEKVLRSLETLEPVITVPKETASLARGAIERMIAIG